MPEESGAARQRVFDEPTEVRPGEELEIVQIDAAIKRAVPGLQGAPEIREFPSGASNLTYLISYGEREFVLRRPPFGHKAKSAHDMKREVKFLEALHPVYACVPKVVASFDADIMGVDFYVMERIRGIIVRRDLPRGVSIEPQQAKELCRNLIDKLAELHGIDYATAGLAGFSKGTGYVRRQVVGWSDRYRKARTADVGDCESVMSWLQAHAPDDSGTCVIHNDFRLDNVVLSGEDPTRIVGVLDWEMATIGDPLMDLGSALAYWVEANDETEYLSIRTQPTHAPGMLTRSEVIEYYSEKTGRHSANFDFYIIFGLFRLAVIMQQIYLRYFHGQTANPRFAGFGQAVRYLESRCNRLILRVN